MYKEATGAARAHPSQYRVIDCVTTPKDGIALQVIAQPFFNKQNCLIACTTSTPRR